MTTVRPVPTLRPRRASAAVASPAGATDSSTLSAPQPSAAGPTVSVVVVTRDRPAELLRCLDALLAVAEQDLEVLVVDSAPRTDLTRRAVHGLDDPRLRYALEERAGASVARNRGVRETRGDAVAFVADDVVVDERWLDCLRTAVAGGASAVAGPVLAVTRSTLRAVGPFDERLGADTPARAGEDLDYLQRVRAHGSVVAAEPFAVARRLPPTGDRSAAGARHDAARGLGAVVAKAIVGRRVPLRAAPAAVWSALRSSPARRATVRGAWAYLRGR